MPPVPPVPWDLHHHPSEARWAANPPQCSRTTSPNPLYCGRAFWGLRQPDPWVGDKHKLCGQTRAPCWQALQFTTPQDPTRSLHETYTTTPDLKTYLDQVNKNNEPKEKQPKCVPSGCPNNVDNVTFDKCRDELQDITVNWGHSLLYLSATSATTATIQFLQHFNFQLFIFKTFILNSLLYLSATPATTDTIHILF